MEMVAVGNANHTTDIVTPVIIGNGNGSQADVVSSNLLYIRIIFILRSLLTYGRVGCVVN